MVELPDGVNTVTNGSQDTDEIMLMPSAMYTEPVELSRNDPRNITERKRGVVVGANAPVRCIDQLESGSLDYVIMKVTKTLPDGTEGADPSKLAIFLQLDGHAQGGFESIYNPTTSTSTTGITISSISELNLPEQFGMWFLTVDQADTKVAVFRGRNMYRHRFRLEVMNTDADSSIFVEFIEVSRRRMTAKEGGSNARGSPADQLGY